MAVVSHSDRLTVDPANADSDLWYLTEVQRFTSKQIAEKLGVSESTVEKQMAQAIRVCAAFFAARDGR